MWDYLEEGGGELIALNISFRGGSYLSLLKCCAKFVQFFRECKLGVLSVI